MPLMTIQLSRLDSVSVRTGATLRVPRARRAGGGVLRLIYQAFAVGTVVGLGATTMSQPSIWSFTVLGVFCVAYLVVSFELDRA
jgi:hypothetical protein